MNYDTKWLKFRNLQEQKILKGIKIESHAFLISLS